LDDEELAAATANEPNAAHNSPHKNIQAVLAPVGEVLKPALEVGDTTPPTSVVGVGPAASFE